MTDVSESKSKRRIQAEYFGGLCAALFCGMLIGLVL